MAENQNPCFTWEDVVRERAEVRREERERCSEAIRAILIAVMDMFNDGSSHRIREGMEVVAVIEHALGLPLRNLRECVVCKKPVNYSRPGVVGSGERCLMWDRSYVLRHHKCEITSELQREWAKSRWWITDATADEEQPPKEQTPPDEPIELVRVK